MTTSADKTAAAAARAANPSAEMREFAESCRALRQRLGLTQKQLAEELGLKDKHSTWRYENLKGHLPSKRTMKAFLSLEHQVKLERGDTKKEIFFFEDTTNA